MNDFQNPALYYLGQSNIDKIAGISIGIAGAGGIGSNVAVNLVRSGFTNLTIADFDKVDYSNLNRQFYFLNQVGQIKVAALKENLLAINSSLSLNMLNQKLELDTIKSTFSTCDVVVEAFDKVQYKKMLVEGYLNSDKLLIAVSGIAGWGSSDDIKIHQIKNNFYIIGDLSSEVQEGVPPLSPRVNIAAAKIADLILTWVLNHNHQ